MTKGGCCYSQPAGYHLQGHIGDRNGEAEQLNGNCVGHVPETAAAQPSQLWR